MTRLGVKTTLFLMLGMALSSCFSQSKTEDPCSFSGFTIYQGAERFTFGSESENLISSVPGENGEVETVHAIQDTFYTSRGFLLFICNYEGSQEQYHLYKYDYQANTSTLIAPIFPYFVQEYFGDKEEPHFLPMDTDYSPCFLILDQDGGYSYAFLDKDEAVRSFKDEIAPIWAGDLGYATTTKYRGFMNTYLFEENFQTTFHFCGGGEVNLSRYGTILSCDEENVYFLLSGNICRSRRTDSGLFEVLHSGYKNVLSDRTYLPSKQIPTCPYYWGFDQNKGELSVLSFQSGEVCEAIFHLERPYSDIAAVHWLVSSKRLLIQSSDRKDVGAFIDLEDGGATIVETTGNQAIKDTFYMDYPIFKGREYDLVERYYPSRTVPSASSIYVSNKKTQEMVLVRSKSQNLFSFQWIVESA